MENTLQRIDDFLKEYEEIKKSNKELLEFNASLQEESRLAREEERSSELKKNRCQDFLNQQQEVIQRLLSVKEENENLKCKLTQTERTLTMIQNNSIEEQMRNDAKVQEIEQEYLKKIIRVQEESNGQVEKVKSEYSDSIDELKASVSKLEEEIQKKDSVIMSLQEEVQHLKEFSAANIETFNKKLTEQERKHQSEIETWKTAELAMFKQAQQNHSAAFYATNQNYQYQSPQDLAPMQQYPHNRFQEPTTGYQNTPLVTHYNNALHKQNTNLVRPLPASGNYQNKTEFLSAKYLYMQNQTPVGTSREGNIENSAEKKKENQKPIMTQKPKILVPNRKRKLFNSNQNLL